MKTIFRNVSDWSPVYFKGGLWVAIAMITAFADKTDGLTRENMESWFWLDYARLVLFVLLSGLIALRTYTDESVSRHRAKLEGQPAIAKPPPTP